MVEHGLYKKHCKVEVYLLEFGLCTSSDERHVVKGNFSRASTVGKSQLFHFHLKERVSYTSYSQSRNFGILGILRSVRLSPLLGILCMCDYEIH